MLRQISGLTTAQWDKEYEKYRKYIKEFREEISQIRDRNEATLAISKIDGYVSLPIVITILADIRNDAEQRLEQAFLQSTDKQIKKTILNKPMRDIFTKIVGKDIRDVFEVMLEESRMADLNVDRIQTILNAYIAQFYEKGIKPHLNQQADVETVKPIFFSLLATALFCISAMDMYQELDDRQTAGWIRIRTLMAPYVLKKFPAEALQKPFIAVSETIKLLHPHEDVKILWNELSIWLEGLFLRSYYQVPEKFRKDGDVVLDETTGKMPTINDKDKSLQDNFDGLTMHQIAKYHLKTAHCINALYTPKLENPEKIAEFTPEITQSITKKKSHLLQSELFTKKNLPHEVIKDLLDESVDMQFTMLVSLFKNYQLSDLQNTVLNEYSGVIISILGEYNAASLSTYFFPTFIRSRPHTSLVNEAIQHIERADTPFMMIQILFDLWKDIKRLGSQDLITKVTTLTKNIVIMLDKSAGFTNKFS